MPGIEIPLDNNDDPVIIDGDGNDVTEPVYGFHGDNSKEETYSKDGVDNNFYKKSDVYTKTEANTNFYKKSEVYTKSDMSSLFKVAKETYTPLDNISIDTYGHSIAPITLNAPPNGYEFFALRGSNVTNLSITTDADLVAVNVIKYVSNTRQLFFDWWFTAGTDAWPTITIELEIIYIRTGFMV